MLRQLGVFSILTSKCAPRHSGVQFLISDHSDLTKWLRTRRFSEPTFRPSRATKHGKNSVSRLFYLFARLDLLSTDSVLLTSSLLTLSLLWLLSRVLFHLSILSEIWLQTSFDHIQMKNTYTQVTRVQIMVASCGSRGLSKHTNVWCSRPYCNGTYLDVM